MSRPVVVVTGIFPPDVGGVATVAAELVEELRALGTSVRVVTFTDQPRVTATFIGLERHGSVIQRYIRVFFALLRHTSSSSVVVATDSLSVGVPARLAQMLRGFRLVLRLGGERSWENAIESGRMTVTLREYWHRHLGGWRQSLFAGVYRWLFAGADRSLFVSRLLLECLVHAGVTPRAPVIVPNGSGARLSARATAEHRGPLRWLYVGRMVRVKNLAFFAEVVRQCQAQGQVFELTCLGDGPEMRHLQGLEHVRCLGPKSAAEVRQMMEMADVLVLPSLTDIFPNVVVEALSCGLPVVMTAEHGLPDGYRGIRFCSPTDAAEWVRVLGALQDRQALQALREEIALPTSDSPSLAGMIHELSAT